MNRTTWILVVALTVVPATLFGQSNLTRQLQQKLTTRKATTSKQADSEAPTSDTKVAIETFKAESPKEFTESLHLATISGNLEGFNQLVSWRSVLFSATKDLKGKPIDEFRESFLKDVESRNSLGAKIIQTVRSGGSYEFLQFRKNENTMAAVFRMLLPGGKGVNYHEYSLAKTKSGSVVASDIYVYLSGEKLSQTIRRNLVSAIGSQETENEVRFTGTDLLLSQNVATIKSLNEALAQKDANNAREQILKLPKELRTDKAIQTLTLNTYQNSNAFVTVLDGVRKACPQDVFMDMIAIDVLVRQKKFGDAITAIERISKRVGGDPYLKILHGRMLLNQGDQQAGRQMIKEAVSEDEGILSGYWNLVSFALNDKDHEETLRLLKKIHLQFKIKFKDLNAIPSYKEFVKSPEYKQWKQYLEASEVAAPTKDPKSPSTANSSSKSSSAETKTK